MEILHETLSTGASLIGYLREPSAEMPAFTTRPAKLICAPEGFTMNVREVRLSAGAGFVVVICGNIMTMPGLPKHPAAMDIDVDGEGKITGLF